MADRKSTTTEKNDDADNSGASSETTSTSAASDLREESQQQTDQVAMVSRTATGEPHQNPGYGVIGLPEDATEEQKAAAENRPAKRKR